MGKHPYWLTGLSSAIALAISMVFFAGAADTASAQTPPELKFLNSSLTQRAKHGDQAARKECPSNFDTDVETATATVFVLLSGTQDAKSIKFLPEVPAAGSEVPTAASDSLSRSSYKQLITENRLIVQAVPAKNEQPGLSIDPSEVKAFTLTFLICSNSEAPGWLYYVWNTSIPPEWSTFAGQLVVKDSDNAQIEPGTVALQLNRPALGYEQTYFWVIIGATVLWALILMGVMAYFIESGKLGRNLEFDFKTALVIPSTTTAAILGTILSATILPNDTFFMSKGQYATLNVLFGLIVVFVAILYNNFKKGRLLWFGAGVALGAGTGEAIAIWFVLKEMAFQGSLPAAGAILFQGTVAFAWVALIVVALIQVVNKINE